METVDVRSTFEALAPLDLKQCRTVGDLVRALAKCSFVARMISEVALTLERWLKAGEKVTIVVSHFPSHPVHPLVTHMFRNYPNISIQFCNPALPSNVRPESKLLVIGRYGEDMDKVFADLTQEIIFLNRQGLCRPSQVGDGYFPNVVFEDPCFSLPVIVAALDEWLGVRVWTVTDLFASLTTFGGVAAEVVHAAKVLKAMVDDPECTVFMTASGAMTIAQMDLLFCDMIEEGMISLLSTTGALMAHGLIKSAGCHQFKHRPEHADELYASQKINRVTDTLEPEENFTHIDEIMGQVLAGIDSQKPTSPSFIHRRIGKYLSVHHPDERGILKSAFENRVPVVVPAFIDSELGNDVFCYNAKSQRESGPKLLVDMEIDSAHLMQRALDAKRLGIFSIGGGVPRNNTQNVAPLIEIYKDRLGLDDLPDRQFHYGCRICPDPMWHGHLSGCTYSENESWRKMENVATSGNFAEVHADATGTWPFILKWVIENSS